MEYAIFIEQLFELVIFPAILILGVFVVNLIKAKTQEAKLNVDSATQKKYIDMIEDTITTCVIATNQTYVESLKNQGKFDAEAQKIAFEKTYQAVITVLNEDIKEYIKEMNGDLEIYLTQKIEFFVNENKF